MGERVCLESSSSSAPVTFPAAAGYSEQSCQSPVLGAAASTGPGAAFLPGQQGALEASPALKCPCPIKREAVWVTSQARVIQELAGALPRLAEALCHLLASLHRWVWGLSVTDPIWPPLARGRSIGGCSRACLEACCWAVGSFVCGAFHVGKGVWYFQIRARESV